FRRTPSKLLHQQGRAAALDFARYPAVKMGRHTGDAPRENLAALADEFFQKIGVLVIDRLDGDVDPSPRHGAIGAAKSRTAFGGLWLHVTSSPGATCAVAKTGCTSSFPIDWVYADSSCSASSCNAKLAGPALWPRCIPM